MTSLNPFGRGITIFRQTLLMLIATLAISQIVSIALLVLLPPPRPDYNRMSDIADTLAGRRFDAAEQNNTDQSQRSLILSNADHAPEPSPGMIQSAAMTEHFARHVGVSPGKVRLFYEADQQAGFPFSLTTGRDVVPVRRGEPVFYNSVIGALDTGHGWRVIRTEPPPLLDAWERRAIPSFGFSLLLLLPLAWAFAGRLARPIRLLADAAGKLGNDPNASPLAIEGPIELRKTGLALNGMQARLDDYLRERTMMIGAIAHDLRTPLSRIAFQIEEAPEAIREPVQEDVEQMRAMIASTINFVKGATTSYVRAPLDLTMLLEDLVAGEIAVGAPATICGVVPATIDGDRIALIRLFQNLIDNAQIYAGRAEVSMERLGGSVIVTVADRGPGLSGDMLKNALEPFVRSDPSRNPETGGVGLGLAIARTIAKDHGGTLELAVREGGGLNAHVTLPLVVDR